VIRSGRFGAVVVGCVRTTALVVAVVVSAGVPPPPPDPRLANAITINAAMYAARAPAASSRFISP
jgi:hypothetical protein